MSRIKTRVSADDSEVQRFPIVLSTMLTSSNAHVVMWTSSGRAFGMHVHFAMTCFCVVNQMRNHIRRIGQDRETEVHMLVVEHTIEDKIETMIAKKQAICGVVGEGRPMTRVSANWLSQMIRLVS